MEISNIDCARLLRDGGIDAIAALAHAMSEAIVGLSPEEQHDMKRTFGQAMHEVTEKIIRPALVAFPELEPDQVTWAAIVKTRAALRINESNQAFQRTPSAPLI